MYIKIVVLRLAERQSRQTAVLGGAQVRWLVQVVLLLLMVMFTYLESD